MMWLLLMTSAAALSAASASAGNYCSSHTLDTNSSGLRFTKEPVFYEYAFEEKFKSIHCCGKGYRSIEWFKDEVAYPWSAGVSNLILYPEAANQTLYTRRASRHDSGNYTCRVSNETHSMQHTQHLEVLGESPEEPKIMYVSKDQWVEAGGELRLFCEALVGKSDFSDTRSDLGWRKFWPNGTYSNLLATQTEIKTSRDDIQEIIGAYLIIPRVAAEDYGTYVCAARRNEIDSLKYVTVHYKSSIESSEPCFEHCVPWRALALAAAGAGVLACALVVLYRRCAARLLLAARIAHARATGATRATAMEKEFDVLVCWRAVDAELVRGALLPTLAVKYKYRVYGVQLTDNTDNWYSELAEAGGRCRSLACVLSPQQLSPRRLHSALSQLHAVKPSPVLLLLQDLPKLKAEAKDSSGESLAGLVRRARSIAWRHLHERSFWTQLRLALPLPPAQNKDDVPEADAKDVRSSSLTALV